MTNNPPQQKILQGILHTADESKQNHKRIGISSHRRRKSKKSESRIDSAAHNQNLKQQKQLNGKNQHIPINITIEYLGFPVKRHCLDKWIKNEDTIICFS
jgi:hypothetical protein